MIDRRPRQPLHTRLRGLGFVVLIYAVLLSVGLIGHWVAEVL